MLSNVSESREHLWGKTWGVAPNLPITGHQYLGENIFGNPAGLLCYWSGGVVVVAVLVVGGNMA